MHRGNAQWSCSLISEAQGLSHASEAILKCALITLLMALLDDPCACEQWDLTCFW